MPEGHGPDPVGQPSLALVIGVILAVTVAILSVALAPATFAEAFTLFRAASPSVRRKL